MKKLKLNLDDIKVESFETINMVSQKGTVLANASGAPLASQCIHMTCVGYPCPGDPPGPTNANTCPQTCDDYTCGSCYCQTQIWSCQEGCTNETCGYNCPYSIEASCEGGEQTVYPCC